MIRKSLGLGAACVLATYAQTAVAASWSQQDILDGECIAFYAMMVGEQPDADPDPGLMAITGFFVGKVEGRHPGYDLTELLTLDLVARVETQKNKIGLRCSEEAMVMADSMMKAGEAMQAMADG